MKNKPTPVAYPTTKEEEYKWGFDVYKPEGMPVAWIHDWTTTQAGWGVTPERLAKVLQFDIGTDLSQITADDIAASASTKLGGTFCAVWLKVAKKIGFSEAIEMATDMAHEDGVNKWKTLQKYFGSPLPLDKIIWYQDITHTLSGPTMKPYSWTDGKKAVCCRTACTMRPPKGLEEAARVCRACDTAMMEGYMAAEPKLLALRAPDLGDDGKGPRCMQMWTYDKTIVEKMPADLKQVIMESTKKILKERGVRL